MVTTRHLRGAATAGPPTMRKSQSPRRQVRVLVLEDSPDVQFILKTELESMGYAVSVAPDGESGLKTAARTNPDVIVSDIGMPGMDGFEFVQRLKLTAMASVPVIAMTGYTQDQDVKRALSGGFAAHLPKPIEPSQLGRLIQNLVRDRTSK